MNILSTSFPSVYEASFGSTESSAKDLLNGLRIKKEDKWYIVGNLAKKGGINPHRITNTSPEEDVYELLFKSALITLDGKVEKPVSITIGFPYTTYNAYKAAAEHFLNKKHFLVEFDTKTFNISGSTNKSLYDIDTFEVIPEIVGCIIGLKKVLADKAPGNFIAISLGFGTMEGGLATEDGLVHRTTFSTHGIQYVIDNLGRELNKSHYIQMKNPHQLDDAMVKGSIFINKKRVDLRALRKMLLEQYYKEVVMPSFRKHFTDQDLENVEKIYLMGGGAFYPELVDAFSASFNDSIPVEIAPEPEKLASIGYLYNSYRISNKSYTRSVGIDIGNSSTVVSIFQKNDQTL